MRKHPEIFTGLLLVIAFAAGAAQSRFFLDFPYLLDSTSLYVETGLVALGMTLIIVAGNIDLSVGSQAALVASATALLLQNGSSAATAIALALTLGAVLGFVNGSLVALFRLPSVIVTLATMALYRGIAQARLGPTSVAVPAWFGGIDRFYIAGIPAPLLLFAVLAVTVALLLHKTVFGQWVVVTGTNERAAFCSGVPTSAVKIWVFTLTGLLAGLAGVLLASRHGVARFDHARGLELDAITAVVLGGASIFGGSGSALGTVLALALLAVVRTGMGLANVKAEYQLAVVGTLLVLSVLLRDAKVLRFGRKTG